MNMKKLKYTLYSIKFYSIYVILVVMIFYLIVKATYLSNILNINKPYPTYQITLNNNYLNAIMCKDYKLNNNSIDVTFLNDSKKTFNLKNSDSIDIIKHNNKAPIDSIYYNINIKYGDSTKSYVKVKSYNVKDDNIELTIDDEIVKLKGDNFTITPYTE